MKRLSGYTQDWKEIGPCGLPSEKAEKDSAAGKNKVNPPIDERKKQNANKC